MVHQGALLKGYFNLKATSFPSPDDSSFLRLESLSSTNGNWSWRARPRDLDLNLAPLQQTDEESTIPGESSTTTSGMLCFHHWIKSVSSVDSWPTQWVVLLWRGCLADGHIVAGVATYCSFRCFCIICWMVAAAVARMRWGSYYCIVLCSRRRLQLQCRRSWSLSYL